MIKLFLTLILILIPSAVVAQTPKIERVANAMIMIKGASGFGDAYESGYLFGLDPKAYEANGALRWATKSPWGLGVVKGSMEAGSDYALTKLKHRHPVWVIIVSGASIGLNVYAIKHNLALIRTVKR